VKRGSHQSGGKMKGKPGYTFSILFYPSINTSVVTKIQMLGLWGTEPNLSTCSQTLY